MFICTSTQVCGLDLDLDGLDLFLDVSLGLNVLAPRPRPTYSIDELWMPCECYMIQNVVLDAERQVKSADGEMRHESELLAEGSEGRWRAVWN